jgi:hypothetical protein
MGPVRKVKNNSLHTGGKKVAFGIMDRPKVPLKDQQRYVYALIISSAHKQYFGGRRSARTAF